MSLKNDVLEYLINNEEEAVSGQKMADIFNVSRNAIWKAINSLNEDGYKINGKSNLGYYSDPNINIYSANYLRKYLDKEFNIDIFDEVDSTSTFLKKLVDTHKMPCLACAYKQNSGRGRTGKSFFSPLNGLYFSFSFKVNDEVDTSLITIKVGVSILKAIEKILDRKCQIKWVNDIYYQKKKICGILTEAVMDYESGKVDTIIIGIGINLYNEEFPDYLKDVATSLGVKECNKNLLIATIINNFFDDNISNEEVLDYYKERCILMNKNINFVINDVSYEGIAININNLGHLVVKTKDGEMTLKSGEVSIGSKVYE